MSDVGDFLYECMRRGVEVRCVAREVILLGERTDVEKLTPWLEKCVDEVLRLWDQWCESIPPFDAKRLH